MEKILKWILAISLAILFPALAISAVVGTYLLIDKAHKEICK